MLEQSWGGCWRLKRSSRTKEILPLCARDSSWGWTIVMMMRWRYFNMEWNDQRPLCHNSDFNLWIVNTILLLNHSCVTLISTKIFHWILFEEICSLEAENSLTQMCSINNSWRVSWPQSSQLKAFPAWNRQTSHPECHYSFFLSNFLSFSGIC